MFARATIHMRPFTLAVAALALCRALAADAAAAESVKLRFAWPSGFASDVQVKVGYSNRTSAGFSDALLVGAYRMAAQSRGNRLLIGFDNPRLRTRSQDGRDPLTEFFLRAYVTRPNFSVERSGRFWAFTQADGYWRSVRADLDRFVASQAENSRGSMREIAEGGVAEELIQSETKLFWNFIAGLYGGLELKQGEPVQRKLRQAVFELGYASVPLLVQVAFTGFVSCLGAATADKCAQLDLSARLDDEAVSREVAARATSGLDLGGARIVVKGYSSERRIRLVTDPNTLIPHTWHQRTVSTAQVEVNGEPDVINQEEEVRLSFPRR